MSPKLRLNLTSASQLVNRHIIPEFDLDGSEIYLVGILSTLSYISSSSRLSASPLTPTPEIQYPQTPYLNPYSSF